MCLYLAHAYNITPLALLNTTLRLTISNYKLKFLGLNLDVSYGYVKKLLHILPYTHSFFNSSCSCNLTYYLNCRSWKRSDNKLNPDIRSFCYAVDSLTLTQPNLESLENGKTYERFVGFGTRASEYNTQEDGCKENAWKIVLGISRWKK